MLFTHFLLLSDKQLTFLIVNLTCFEKTCTKIINVGLRECQLSKIKSRTSKDFFFTGSRVSKGKSIWNQVAPDLFSLVLPFPMVLIFPDIRGSSQYNKIRLDFQTFTKCPGRAKGKKTCRKHKILFFFLGKMCGSLSGPGISLISLNL